MTDITTEDLLEVAKAAYPKSVVYIDEGGVYVCETSSYFLPLTSDADAFKVLEALVEQDKYGNELQISKSYGFKRIKCSEWGASDDKTLFIDMESNLRTAIVKSYLSLIGEIK